MKKKILLIFIILFLNILTITIITEDCKMEVKGYEDLGIISSKKPANTHLWIEVNSSGIIYMVPSGDLDNMYKSIDKGETWSNSLGYSAGYDFQILSPDLANDKIYFMVFESDDEAFLIGYVDLTDDSFNIITSFSGGYNGEDVLYIGATWRWTFTFDVVSTGRKNLLFWEDSPGSDGKDMGLYAGRTHEMSYLTGDGSDKAYYLWQWSNENVELWRYDETVGTVVELQDLGANTVLVPKDQRAITYDGNDVLSFIVQDSGDSKFYLWTYSITDDITTKHGEYNVALMLDRNTAPGILEKAFSITVGDYRVYQLHDILTSQLHLIYKVDSDADIIAITDNFLMNDDGDMFEYIDNNEYIFTLEVDYGYMKIPNAFMTAINIFKISPGQFIRIEDMFTSSGISASQTLFEGYVQPFVEQKFQEVILRSPADELLRLNPEGDYSGRTDEIMVALLGDYTKYVTPGTLSAGTELGQVHFNGDKSIFQIFNEFALTDNFLWALTPTGQLDYNDGTVDSTINISETDNVVQIIKRRGPKAVNDVKVKGSIAAGDQVQGDGAENLPDIQLNGRTPFDRTISHLNTNALCTTTEGKILLRWGVISVIVDFLHFDPTIGVIQVGQTITFQFDEDDPNVPSDQFIIKDIQYNARGGIPIYTITDVIM